MKILSYKKEFCATWEKTVGGAIDRKRIDPDVDQPAEVAKNATQKNASQNTGSFFIIALRQTPHTRVFFSKN